MHACIEINDRHEQEKKSWSGDKSLHFSAEFTIKITYVTPPSHFSSDLTLALMTTRNDFRPDFKCQSMSESLSDLQASSPSQSH